MGLSICHKIIKAMGGELSVQSEYGVGSTFKVSFQCEVRETKFQEIKQNQQF